MYAVVAPLVVESARMRKTAFAKLETDVGINYCQNGILLERALQRLYSPVDHMIVDWMHTMCSDGVGNTGIWTVMQFLKAAGYSPSYVREFVTVVHMPSKYGKADPAWLNDNRLQGTSYSSFSSVVLNVVPILYLFFEQFCSNDPRLKVVGMYP